MTAALVQKPIHTLTSFPTSKFSTPTPVYYPNCFLFISFGTIYLCDVFWEAPTQGANSKVSNSCSCMLDKNSSLSYLQGGTLIHEASHFTQNAGTKDHVYGQDDCKLLAQNDPDTAVDNADSHEYFAENDPALP